MLPLEGRGFDRLRARACWLPTRAVVTVQRDDVIELARRGKLRASKQGRFWRFKHNDVLVYKKKFESMAAS